MITKIAQALKLSTNVNAIATVRQTEAQTKTLTSTQLGLVGGGSAGNILKKK
jgi:hypothetical protein